MVGSRREICFTAWIRTSSQTGGAGDRIAVLADLIKKITGNQTDDPRTTRPAGATPLVRAAPVLVIWAQLRIDVRTHEDLEGTI
ncbi:hypothetical protein [Kibdelosporangium aridum]|uniref:hypothetical protein n=1 Tax=Kibdelosporangium aridum TaxID=2030 RepID=UPI000AB9800C|nr:hypothetical protein [Kibdelosporangium aridum]